MQGYPADLLNHPEIDVRYEVLEGWRTDITAVRRWEDLPELARTYVLRLEELVGSPVEMLSVGPERDQVILRGGAA